MTVWRVLKSSLRSFEQKNGSLVSAAISFYALLSASPLAIAVVLFAGSFLDEQTVQQEMVSQLKLYIGQDAANHLKTLIARTQQPENRSLATGLGLLILLFASSRLFSAIRAALNQIWGIEQQGELKWHQLTKRAFKRRIIALLLVMVSGLIMTLAILWKTVAHTFSTWLPSRWHYLHNENGLDIIAAFILFSLLFLLIFKWLPDKSLAWKHVALGGTVTAGLFVLGSLGAGLYLQRITLFSAYGSAGTIAMVFLWAYYSAHVFVLGAAFAYQWAKEKGEAQLQS